MTDQRYAWASLRVVLVGTSMVMLDTTLVNVALPQIGLDLGRPIDVDWVVTGYFLAIGVCQPATGWLADRFGRKRTFIAGLAVFTVGSLAAGFSPTLETLVVARMVEGLGAGTIASVGMTIIFEGFPPDRRGTALGVWGVAAMSAPAFGPVIGGYIVTAVSWHWLFFVNIPVGVGAMVLAGRVLIRTGDPVRRAFDGVGLGLISAAMTLWLVAFARARAWTWGSPLTLGLLLLGALALVLFVHYELRVETPVIDIRIFRVPTFSLAMAIIGGVIAVQFAILVFLPITLQTAHSRTAFEVGTMLVPAAVAGAVTFPIGGYLTDRIGARVPVAAGALLLAGSTWVLSNMMIDTPVWVIEVAVVLQGLGFGLTLMPATVTAMNVMPVRYVAQISAVRQLNIRIAALLSVAILATIAAMQLGDTDVQLLGTRAAQISAQAAYNTVFRIAAIVGGVVAFLALFLPGMARTRAIHAERASEEAVSARDIAFDSART